MLHRHQIVPAAAGLLMCLSACGPSGGHSGVDGGGGAGADGGALEGLVSIDVEPADQELVIDGSTPATSDYTAVGHFDDGRVEEITDKVVFSLSEPAFGSFSQNSFTSSTELGGRVTVRAVGAGVEGSTGLLLRLRKRHSDPLSTDLPADPEAPFGGPDDPGRAPSIVYPNDNVLLPPNLRFLELHFLPGQDNTLFEISFENDLTDVKVYARCTTPLNNGCIYAMDESVWSWLANTNRGADPLEVTARATDDAGTGVGTSETMHLSFSFEDIHGGIYYWKAAGGAQGDSAIMRYDFGDSGQMAAERFVGPSMAGGKCVGCHALSRDGSKLVAAAGGWDVEDILLLDVGNESKMGSPAKTAFESWNPDGTKYVGVFGYEGTSSYDLLLFDGDSGGSLGTIDVGASEAHAITHPDWSPDGDRIAYVREGIAYDTGTNNQRFYQGSIEMVEQSGGSWGSPVELVPAESGANYYYPSFSPDGELLAFNRSTCPGGADTDQDCNGDSDPTATIYLMEPQADADRIALARANAPGPMDSSSDLRNSWPKWAPFSFQRTSDESTRLLWITFSSSRTYGLRAPPDGSSAEADTGSLLWMAAVDPDRALDGEDPSYPAFCLPFQDITSSNHIAQWTEEVVSLQ